MLSSDNTKVLVSPSRTASSKLVAAIWSRELHNFKIASLHAKNSNCRASFRNTEVNSNDKDRLIHTYDKDYRICTRSLRRNSLMLMSATQARD